MAGEQTRAVIGLDIGGTKTLGVVLDAHGAVVAEARRATVGGAEAVLASLEEMTAELRLLAPDDLEIAAVGVGVAGLVDHDGVLRHAPNLTDADEFAIGSLLAPLISLPVIVDNDANCAGRAEVHSGAAVGVQDAVLITLGTGIGGAVISGGQVRRGAHGVAAELGHMIVDPNGPPCPCGRSGCWERFASGAGLVHVARDLLEPARIDELAGGSGAEFRGEHITAAARAGAADAATVLDRFAWWVALGLSNLTAVLDPELFVIGGGLATDWDLFGDAVAVHLGDLALSREHLPPTPLLTAAAGERAGALGAALLAADWVGLR